MKTLVTLFLFIFFESVYSQNYFISQYNKTPVVIQQKDNLDLKLNFKERINSNEKHYDDDFFIALDDYLKNSTQVNRDIVFSKITTYQSINDKNKILESINVATDLSQIEAIFAANKAEIESNFEEDDYKLINEKVKNIKINNTNSNIFTTVKKTKAFKLWESKNYDIDTFNNFFTNQDSEISAFRNISLQTFSNATYLNAELISFYFNYLRFGVSGSLKATNNVETDAEAIKQELTKLLHNNGSINFNFSLPLIFKRTTRDHIHYGVYAETSIGLTPNFSANVSESGKSEAYFSNDILVNHQFGLNTKIDISSNESAKEKKARFFIELPINYIYGNTKSYQLLDITDNTTAKISIGAILGDKISFRVSGPLLSTKDQIMRTPFLFSLDFSPTN